MRDLALRLVVPLAAVVLVGLAIVDVAFVFWGQSQLNRQRTLELRAAALATALALDGEAEPAPARLDSLAAAHAAELTLVRHDGEQFSTLTPVELPDFGASDRVVAGGAEWVTVRPQQSVWQLVVAQRRIDPGEALAWQRPALLFLLAVAAFMVVLALLFLRRSVLAPVERMTELVGSADRDGLSRFGRETTDGFARLSSAIVGMTQRIDDDRVRIAEQLEELSATQQQLVRAERLAVVGQLAAGLAHEIGNPLAVLSGYVEVLGDGEMPAAERADALARMTRELDRIHAIMRDLLDFSRAPAAAAGAGDVRDALRHVAKLLGPQERFRDIELTVVEPESAIEVPLETNALTQVLLNLLFNAADAVGDEGRVRVAAERGEHDVTIRVEDSGPGVPEDAGRSIFEPFFTTKPTGEGTGLGLAVCDHMVSSVGGDITVEKSDLGGAGFSVRLPVATARG